ncbi:MAG: DUF2934 domain-containing protein [Candidatus Omnitrophica bacterium]|nr:DUF2934 domain-containing protein [Candidatus Omnitrophota bacterium]
MADKIKKKTFGINESASAVTSKGVKRAEKSSTAAANFEDWVKNRAYHIWQETGRPEGKDMEIWLQAEKEFNTKRNK